MLLRTCLRSRSAATVIRRRRDRAVTQCRHRLNSTTKVDDALARLLRRANSVAMRSSVPCCTVSLLDRARTRDWRCSTSSCKPTEGEVAPTVFKSRRQTRRSGHNTPQKRQIVHAIQYLERTHAANIGAPVWRRVQRRGRPQFERWPVRARPAAVHSLPSTRPGRRRGGSHPKHPKQRHKSQSSVMVPPRHLMTAADDDSDDVP